MESYHCCSLLLSHGNSRSGDKSFNSCRVTRDDGISRNILRDDASGADNCFLSNRDIAEYCHSGTNRCAFLHHGPLDLPIVFGLQPTLGRGCARVGIIDESYAVTDENVVLDRDAFANEAVAGNLAVLSDGCVLLNFNKRSYFRVVAYLAAVNIDEFGKPDVSAELYIRGDTHEVIHSLTTLPFCCRDWSAASSMRTTLRPAWPPLNGSLSLAMHSIKYAASALRASTCSTLGAHMTP